MMSLWRDDVDKDLVERCEHLLAKAADRWVWVVGDCSDETELALRAIARGHMYSDNKDITVIRHDTQIEGDDPKTRVRRLSLTANAGFDDVREKDVYWIIHESDLKSPDNLVELLMETGKCPVAGWPVLEGGAFYDTWAYVGLDDIRFRNNEPYHPSYRAKGLFEVKSVGSVWMFHAEDLRRGVRCYERAVVELCDRLRELGRRFWVAPHIKILQPLKYFVSRHHA